MKQVFLIISTIINIFLPLGAYSFTPSLNILAPMRMLDPKLIEQFEQANGCNVKVEFAPDRTGYESHLRSEIRVFDVVIADEQTLNNLTTSNLLRMLPENLRQSKKHTSPLQVKTQFNAEVNTYAPIFVNPLGIAYNKSVSKMPIDPTWAILTEPETNPFWRQRVFVSKEYPKPIFISLLATHGTITNPKKIPPEIHQWFAKMHIQRALNSEPLELAFLGQFVNVAALFYADYLRYKNIVPDLNFIIPQEGTYFDRYGIAWCLSSTQEKLAKKFIAFMLTNSKKFTKYNGLFDIKYGIKTRVADTVTAKKDSPFINDKNIDITAWKLYDESAILPFLPAQGLDL